MSEANAHLSTDEALVLARRFFRHMGQPMDPTDGLGTSLWGLNEVMKREKVLAVRRPPHDPPHDPEDEEMHE